MKKYYVSIEQPLVKTFEVEANNIEEALNIARENYDKGIFNLSIDDIGTDAQIMATNEEQTESVDWSYL